MKVVFPEPEGFEAISRWSSAATPPEIKRRDFASWKDASHNTTPQIVFSSFFPFAFFASFAVASTLLYLPHSRWTQPFSLKTNRLMPCFNVGTLKLMSRPVFSFANFR
jgi:hypothetical protein